MSKKKIIYSCQSCGSVHFKWAGRCSECGQWNSIVEEFAEGASIDSSHFSRINNEKFDKKNFKKINLVDLDGPAQEFARITTKINELDRVLGGGIVLGSVVLIGGDPGIGKSTLLLQTAKTIALQNKEVIYLSGEESVDQVRLRSKRLGISQDCIKLASTTNINEIINSLNCLEKKPHLIIIDSIQTMFVEGLSSSPGTVAQVRASASELTNFAKKNNVTLFIVSHVTKDGQIAGPKVLEHIVDTVLYFEGEKDLHFRILRAIKNRFGAAGEIGIFEMNELGLNEVSNPSELFLASYSNATSGTVVYGGIEGTRPLLIEIQSLIAPSYMPSPRRAVVGWDNNRLAMIIAILGARFGLNLSDKEVYLNVVGGIEINETAADLAVACSLISAAYDIAIPYSMIAVGEVGLTGEVRMVSNLELRLKEAYKLGFKNCIIPKLNEKNKNFLSIKKSFPDMEITTISHIRELSKLFSKKNI